MLHAQKIIYALQEVAIDNKLNARNQLIVHNFTNARLIKYVNKSDIHIVSKNAKKVPNV